jgi:uncharacterized protein (TIGR00730 family)
VSPTPDAGGTGNARRIAVYCGASARVDEKYLAAARHFGAAAARARLGIVYGGCSTGLMGAVADGALAEGGEVIGVLPDVLGTREPGHPGLTQMLRVPDMHTRKAVMTAFSSAFVALPGGYGTLDELFEALTWRMIGTHSNPVALLDVGGYWKSLIEFIDHATQEKLVAPHARDFFFVDDDAGRVLQRLFPSSTAR